MTAGSVDAYIAAQPADVRKILELVRAAVRKGLPKAEETISYQIPAYKQDGRAVLYFAAWKKHYSVYPVTPGLLAELEQELSEYKVSKGTIQFPLTGSVPVKLIERIARIRAEETKTTQK